MKTNYYQEFKEDLAEFREITQKFYRKEITVPEYKGFSGGFGSYAQRGGERSMLRLRLAGGEIDLEKVKFIADSIQKYHIDLVHLTTCQTVQLHNLTAKTVCQLVEEAWQCGIITRGGGGDFPRNVMCSPLSGISADECLDVLPYAKEAGEYLLSFIHKVKLPRKLKVCFSNGAENTVHATFRDLGFVAKENGKFDVYCAGGLGIKPKFGVKVVTDLEPQKVLYVIKTMVDVFTEHGNYEKRAASRSRFLQETLGVEGLQKVFAEKLAQNLAEERLDLTVQDIASNDLEAKAAAHKGEERRKDLLENNRIFAQKQEGLYAVAYSPIGGAVALDFFEHLYFTAKNMEYPQAVKIRLTPEQGMYIINLTADEATQILELTKDSAQSVFERSTACIGADICQVGIGKSQSVLEACVTAVRQANLPKDALPAIHISGCPSSCSAHQTARIGLRGGIKQTPDGAKPAFAVYDNGSEKLGSEQMGDELGVITVEDLPRFFVKLGQRVAEEKISYEEYAAKYPEQIKEIAAEFTA